MLNPSKDRYEPLPEFINSEESTRLWQEAFYLVMNGFTMESLQRILHLFKEALCKNPERVSELALIIHDIDCFMAPSQLTELGIEACQRALKAEPENPQILWALSHFYEKLMQYEQSFEVARHLVRINPSYKTWKWLVHILIKLERQEEAIQIIKELVVKEPRSEYWRLLGEVLQETGRLEEALEAYRSALSIYQDPLVWGFIADIYRKQGNYDYAIKAYHQAIKFAKAEEWKQEQYPIEKSWLEYWEFRLQELQARKVSKSG